MTDTRFYPLTIERIRNETESAVVVDFSVDDELASAFKFKQGQYLTLSAEIDGQTVRRSYSVCTGVDEGKLAVAIRRIEGGLFSNYVNDSLRQGQIVGVMPPQGEFYTELDPANEKHYMCIAAGSGITPIISIIKSVLAKEPKSRVTLIYGNRRSNTIMFKEELGFVKNRYMDRFNWINVLSQERQDAEVLYGRIDNKKGAELQAKGLIELSNVDEFFLCGPHEMITNLSSGLRKSNINEANIHYELFFASSDDAEAVKTKRDERSRLYSGKVSQVSVTWDGRTIDFPLPVDGDNVLDGAMKNGVDLPFSCKGGVCATCKCRVLEGTVDMDVNHALSDGEIAQGVVLACQAHPLSSRVVLDFDHK